jgi:glucose/arabinose dehydrogenase
MDPDTLILDRNSREEIWRSAPTSKKIHNGGAMLFGNDGKFYVTTGEGGDSKMAQPLNNVLGSIIRLNHDGSIPADNPYADNGVRCADTGGVTSDGGFCSEVWANGLRNPFRLSMDYNVTDSVRFSISDVGKFRCNLDRCHLFMCHC